jgi:hypothetical protein
MELSSYYLKRIPQRTRLRSSVWSAVASVIFVTGYASSPGNDRLLLLGRATDWHPAASSVSPKAARLSSGPSALAEAPRPVISAPLISFESFVARFSGRLLGSSYPLPVSSDDPPLPASHPSSLPLGPGDDNGAKHRHATYSVINDVSLGETPAVFGPEVEPDAPKQPHAVLPRSDLLDGVPEVYAALVVRIAAEEKVDPNWVLAVIRAENAGFDRQLASPAGAVGLMQVMPQTGKAFGATDLTDPEQNIRAGTRFLNLLIDKYRNPVLIASAYNAGEPRVDANHSLPLIRETADYVTRVVGYYTGMPATVPTASLVEWPRAGTLPHTYRGRAARAKSPMLVFSVAEPPAALGPARRQPDLVVSGGPVKIVKEEAVQ